MMKGILIRVAGAALLSGLFTYAGDYLSIRYQIPKGREQFSTVAIFHHPCGKVEKTENPGKKSRELCLSCGQKKLDSLQVGSRYDWNPNIWGT